VFNSANLRYYYVAFLVSIFRKNAMLQNFGGEIRQCLTHFISECRSKRKSNGDRSIGHVTVDGVAAGAAWVEPAEPGKAGADAKRLQDEVVAIVDDDECARWGLRALIESLGQRAATFASAEEYLASGVSGSTACLILDVHLPGMSGPCLQAHLLAAARCPPTVFVTGRLEEHVQKQVIAAGALGYLPKPCNEKSLLHCIGSVLCTTT